MSYIDPLAELRSFREETWFQEHDHALLAALRARQQRADAVAGLAAASGVRDEPLLAMLAERGITPQTLRVLHLLPLLQVAWADGQLQPAERALLLQAGAEAQVAPGSPSWPTLAAWLEAPPPPELVTAALRFTALSLAAEPPAEAAAETRELEGLAYAIAEAAGGVLGFFPVRRSEGSALAALARQLHPKLRGPMVDPGDALYELVSV